MHGKLVVIAGADTNRFFPFSGDEPLSVGRGQDSGTRLRDRGISRFHCELREEDGKVILVDSGSAAGTFVNGNRIVDPYELRPGDVIQIGETQMRWTAEEVYEHETLGGAAPVAAARAAPAAGPATDSLSKLVGQSLSSYTLVSMVAEGKSGAVFRADDTKNDRPVALKVLHADFAKDEAQVDRFVRAMKTMFPLRHPNLVSLYNAGKSGPYCWLAMEYVDGESMTQVIERIGVAGRIDWKYALRVAVHVARALDYAYERKVIHRNITPPNILVSSSDKTAKLGDLMLAKAMEGALAEQVTRPGELVGDLAYMSPERTRGAIGVDCRSDIYSLGATVYALLAGRPPHEGGSIPEMLHKIREEEPVKPKKYQLAIADQFEGAVLRMLAKRPEDRHQTPNELLADLERVAKYQGVAL